MSRLHTQRTQCHPNWAHILEFAFLPNVWLGCREFTLSFLLLLWSINSAFATEIALVKEGGVFSVPVRVNGAITLNFIIDSGATDVHIPSDVVMTLIRTGTISQDDFLPGKVYQMADGSTVESPRFVLQRLEIADHVVDKVIASIGSVEGALLLGQSLLARLPAWSLDNQRHVLILADAGAVLPQPATELNEPSKKVDSGPFADPAAQSSPSLPPIPSSTQIQPTTWQADWGHDIRASARMMPCTVRDFAAQGYNYALSVDIPVSRLTNSNESFSISSGRAQTVEGCWFKKGDGLVHAKMRRKKDEKIWEQDLNFNDGSWVAGSQPQPDKANPITGSSGYIYFAAETSPTADSVPPEAPLCYRFNVMTLEEQLNKLKKKYGDFLYGVSIEILNNGTRSLRAERKGEQAEIVTYRYFESSDMCMEYQRDHLGEK